MAAWSTRSAGEATRHRMKVRKAVFTAAGLGTRLLPATKAQPKEMLPLVDKPIIQYVVEEAVASGIEQIIIVTGRGKRAIEDHFDMAFELEYFLSKKGDNGGLKEMREIAGLADICYIRQKEPLGQGHAIRSPARWWATSPSPSSSPTTSSTARCRA